MISTCSMIKLNKTYGNLMVDLKISNLKLLDRGIRIIETITGLSYKEASKLLTSANNNVKAAIVMNFKDVSYKKAVKILNDKNGHLRSIIEASI